ncbi:TMEM43 family protein [Magnetospirillum sulfuroxidans]|uniref:TMEM43 family protein n=1 Tax=Magnetospirillum sulfuroxidans TaxID=611300 RepID=A0ABS5IC63_9PROT|nr:TMEM43 family protein [Magnetospirillum sulfuroxidans]MBR9971283.1 TMEM43 family protein [Magnetospirillum sulfuroxidans]
MQEQEDVAVEVTERGWMNRIGDSFKAMLVGLVLIVVSFPVLIWNEGRAIDAARSLAEGRATVTAVAADAVSPGNDGHLVHLSGRLTSSDVLVPATVLARPAIKLHRNVEVFQWEESSQSQTRDKVGGGSTTETTYTYRKAWSGGLNDSTQFHKPGGHKNPAAMPVSDATQVVENARVGAFRLTRPVLDQVDFYQPVPAESLSALAARDLRRSLTVAGEWAYSGAADDPKVGDFRVAYSLVPAAEISIIARQNRATLEPHHTRNGEELLIVRPGVVGADTMFAEAERDNAILTWILRLVGWLVMLFGFVMLSRLLVALAAVIPLLADIVAGGIFLVALPLSLCLSLVTIALAWIAFRPLIGIPLLVLAGAAAAAPFLRRRFVKA